MTYSTEIAKDNIQKRVFIRMRPKYRVTGFTLYSGSVYRAAFSEQINSTKVNNSSYTLTGSVSVGAGQYYHDVANGYLYVRKGDSSAITSSDWIVVTYELFLSTEECYWYEDPTDDTTDEVFWHSLIIDAPRVTRSCSDILFGFIPTSVTNLVCVNSPDVFQHLLHDSSFYDSAIDIWHGAGRRTTANFHQIFSGLLGEYSFNDKTISFSILEKSKKFNQLWTNALPGFSSPRDRFTATGGGYVTDPNFVGTFIPSIYGSIFNSFEAIGVNGDWVNVSPATTDNRPWLFESSAGGQCSFDVTIVTINTTTDFDIAVADAKKLMVGDRIRKQTAPYTCQVSSINFSTGNVTFSAAPDTTGNVFHVIGHPRARLIQNNTVYELSYFRDYVDFGTEIQNSYGITLTSTAEANVGASTIDPANGDYIVSYVRGHNIAPTANGSPFYSGRLPYANPIVILYHILKDRMGFAESEIDITTLQSLASSHRFKGDYQTYMKIAVPQVIGDQPPTFADVISKIMSTIYGRIYFNDSGKITVKLLEASGTADASFGDDDLISIDYSYQYASFGKIKLNSHPVESAIGVSTSKPANIVSDVGFMPDEWRYPYVDIEPDQNTYLYASDVKIEISSYQEFAYDSTATDDTLEDTFFATYAENVSDVRERKFSHLIGDRRNFVRCYIKSGGHQLEIGDVVSISRAKQPGYSYDSDTTQSRSYFIVEITKELAGVSLVLDDQKGIEQNSGDW